MEAQYLFTLPVHNEKLNSKQIFKLLLEKEITLCSIYIPPSFALRPEHLNSLLKQLPSPFMLLGDFNGYNILWGSKDNDPRGDLIEDFITNNDICLMNDKSNTFLDSGKGTFSALDLSNVTHLFTLIMNGQGVRTNIEVTIFLL